MKLQPFSQAIDTCPKCDCDDLSVKYWEAGSPVAERLNRSEHLRVECNGCGYAYAMACADKTARVDG